MKKNFVKLSILVLLVTSSLAVLAQSSVEQPFTDINQYSKYFKAAVEMKRRNVIEGYADGSFKPNQKANRAETLKIFQLGSGVTIVPERVLPFPDTGSGSWYGSYVQTALDLGIAQGYPDGMFRPEKTVNKVESLKMLTKLNNIPLPTVALGQKALFQDTPITSDTLWYQPYVFYADESNVVDDKTIYSFAPSEEMTRGELLEMMYRLILIRERDLQRFDTSQSGVASFYGNGVEGNKVASGEYFSNEEFSAAHTYLPFGTFLVVFNTNKGTGTLVRVNDRGPYVEGRVVDLSQAAFGAIESFSKGLANVKVVPVGVIPGLKKHNIDAQSFFDATGNRGIQLERTFPSIFLPGESYTFRGNTVAPASIVTALLTDQGDKREFVFQAPVTDGTFSLPVVFPKEGTFRLSIIPGTTGVGAVEVFVVSPDLFEKSGISNLIGPTNAPLKVTMEYGGFGSMLKWDPNNSNLFQIIFSQGGKQKVFYNVGENHFAIPYDQFVDFAPQLPLRVEVRGGRTSSDFSVDRNTPWSEAGVLTVTPARHEYEIYKQDKVVFSAFSRILPSDALLLEAQTSIPLNSQGWYIAPDGFPHAFALSDKKQIDAGEKFSFSIPLDQTGTYIVEINDLYGEAVFNFPFYSSGVFPVLPNPRDIQANFETVSNLDVAKQREMILADINTERKLLGLSPLSLDSKANSLAQARTDDMAKRDYFSHTTPEGKNALDLSGEYGITGTVGENLAKDLNPVLALYGLFRSAGHRNLLLTDRFSRIGIGFSKSKDDAILMAQIFY